MPRQNKNQIYYKIKQFTISLNFVKNCYKLTTSNAGVDYAKTKTKFHKYGACKSDESAHLKNLEMPTFNQITSEIKNNSINFEFRWNRLTGKNQ